jgi:hypothetical protein
MIDNQDVEIEYSPLSREVTHDGIKVKVEIYKLRGAADGWSLEVVDHEGASTVWDNTFPTDQDAYREFSRTLESEGIRAFLETAPSHRQRRD